MRTMQTRQNLAWSLRRKNMDSTSYEVGNDLLSFPLGLVESSTTLLGKAYAGRLPRLRIQHQMLRA
jgi:hypothetical protein